MCSPKLLQGCRLHHLRTSTRLGWRFGIDWIPFILFTSHLRWSPRPLLHSWQQIRPASVSDKDREISRPQLSEVKSRKEEKIAHEKRRWWKAAVYAIFFFFSVAVFTELNCNDSFRHFQNESRTTKVLIFYPNTTEHFSYKYAVCPPLISLLLFIT